MCLHSWVLINTLCKYTGNPGYVSRGLAYNVSMSIACLQQKINVCHYIRKAELAIHFCLCRNLCVGAYFWMGPSKHNMVVVIKIVAYIYGVLI